MKKGTVCTKKQPCPGMAYALDRKLSDRNRVGFDFALVFDLATGKSSELGYLYRRTNKDSGIVLNLCPFCGEDFRKLWPRPKAKKAPK